MSQPADARPAPAPTVHDALAVTRLDGPAPTVRDAAPTERASLLSLPAALADRYRVVRHLPTQGAEADLLVVESCIEPGQQAVAKLYRPGIQPKSEVLQRINAEAPCHVVRLLEYGQSEGIGYELLEYAEQGSLRDWMAEGALAETQVREILVELSAALAELHTHHILHRDLKPANVLVRSRQPLQLVLTDFGIASLAEATLHFTTMNRTVQYSAPEAATGVIGTAADYWSLGMILVEALTGQHPFAGLSPVVMQYQLTVQGIPVEGVAEPWRTLCRGLLLRDPKQRWGGVEVERWLAGDATLQLPAEKRSTQEARATRPYRLGGEECWTARELALQMARHWATASKDLGRGFITDWLRNDWGDQDLTRAVLDVLDAKNMSADERLLRVLVKIAPDLPPVWKQWSLAKEDLIATANQANQGDEACRGLVSDLYQRDVLEIYARAGNVECQRIRTDWRTTVKNYEETWQIALMNNRFLAKSQPDLVVALLPSLLLATESPIFQDALAAQMKSLMQESFERPAWFSALLASSLHKGAVLAIRTFLPKLRSLSLLMASRYLDNGDGTVTDVETGLQWMCFSLGQKWQNETCIGEAKRYTWQKALDAAKALNCQGGYAGYRDWRVPTKEELQTLIYSSSGQPKIWNDTGELCKGDYERPTLFQPAFPNTPSGLYWSSSVYAYGSGSAWFVNFYYGGVGADGKALNIHARLVRDGQ
ncbi:MAG: DUF1566 domain-containing protein [Candidatus Competibacteraceae bacterium]|nr:DUF1566 domain-containing protein [Candidatus Competibacteraceae bacterium]MCB1769940.1 DUF1566 domain-containing protein [Candidatus Competibacteraceae bacterium]MCB1820128.1 DUF1566 domain-containing protein [Candidatus Competibacteraceae bacterium]